MDKQRSTASSEFLCDCSDHTAMKLALSSVLSHPYLRQLSQSMVLVDITLEHSENNITRAPLASGLEYSGLEKLVLFAECTCKSLVIKWLKLPSRMPTSGLKC